MRLRDRLWNPYAVVFISSACVMVIELVASRIIAPRLGVSLYTWTSVIGVILAGISLGNYIGGRLSDRFAAPRLLGLVFTLASLTSLSILWLNNDLHEVSIPALPLILWVVGYIAAVFFVPSMILGCVSPIVVKLSLVDLNRSGTTVGKIYAWSSVGSIVGTFATGFWLISWLGTKNIVLAISGILMLLGLWFLTDTTPRRAIGTVVVALALMGGGIWALGYTGYLRSECLDETNYFCINVKEREIGGRTVRQLSLDRLVHSYTDIEDPSHLVYGYEQTYAGVVMPLMERKPDLRAFFIGGGGYTFPRYLEAMLPESHLVVSEIDPGVTDVAQQLLGLDPASRIVIENLDARLVMSRMNGTERYDLIFGDAFNDFSVPYHLTTIEFDRIVDDLLTDEGLYVANIIDGGRHGHFMRAYVRTLQEIFPYVAVVPTLDDWREAARGTYVVVASRSPIDLSALPVGDTPLTPDELQAYLDLEEPLVLTDDYVPVDNLLAPVFADSHAG
ncbi:MAG: fused MFS/spermidine synthase [Anaerolineae bacterium]